MAHTAFLCYSTGANVGLMFQESGLKLLLKALEFFACKHKDQRRKDYEASPYINHPIALANILVNHGHVTDVETICGVLHDTVEDTETTPEERSREFGDDIRDIVLEFTDNESLPKAVRKRLQIEHASHLSSKAKVLKLADKIANLTNIATSPPAG